jgi:HK97 family phage prohead protease
VTKRNYDFAGWVTKHDIKCSDGVIIKHDAFRENDGQTVPLVWNHDYNSPNNVLGHVVLQHRDAGVYGYGYFNETNDAQNAKTLVQHGDISSMSIGARRLKRELSNVVQGSIYEVSLVLAGANPGAMIDSVVQHSDDEGGEKATIFTGTLIHSYDDIIDDEVSEEVEDDKDPEASEEVEDEKVVEDEKINHKITDETTIQDVIDTMNDDQKEAVYALLALASETGDASSEDDKSDEESQNEDEDLNHNDDKGDDTTMKNNVFNKEEQDNKATLKHAANEILKLAFTQKASSLRDVLRDNADTLTHGINSIEMLFPDAYASTNGNVPIIYKDPNTQYVAILNGVNKTPFSRVKTLVADLTEDEARAKGYIKGSLKKEEFFSLIKRVTTPTTVYKKQKLDRDDIIDIVDFDVVAFMNVEMQMMLKEEIARAILVGDGRDFSSDEKINESNIRPIISDNEFFTIHKSFASADVFIEAVIKAMAEYRGSGLPSMYIDPTVLADVKLLKGTDGRYLFGDIPSNDAIATRLGLKEIVPTTFMSGKGAIIVNLSDYSLGATKGGQVTSFDQFDIDYNQHKYLIETRLSGALTLPKSAIHLKSGTAATGADDVKGGLTYGERQADKPVTP